MRMIKSRIRLIKRINFRYLRLILYSVFRLWLKKIHNRNNLPKKGPCIVVSNHTSYVDWIILSAIYKDKYIVFLGNKELNHRPIVKWLMKLNILIYIDTDNPGYSYFRDVVRRLRQGHIVVIYPEGTRSKSGNMIAPKIGFVKLALLTNVPIVPLAIKGAYDILPPHKTLPKLQRCEIVVGDEIRITADNPLFKDIFSTERNVRFISKELMEEIAFRIMDLVRNMAGQRWDENVTWKFKPKKRDAKRQLMQKT